MIATDGCAKLLSPLSNFTQLSFTAKMQFSVITEVAAKHNYCIYLKLLDVKTFLNCSRRQYY